MNLSIGYIYYNQKRQATVNLLILLIKYAKNTESTNSKNFIG